MGILLLQKASVVCSEMAFFGVVCTGWLEFIQKGWAEYEFELSSINRKC